MHDHIHGGKHSMNQMIFKIGLPVETISVYLLCCGFTDTGKTLTTGNLGEVWNGTGEALAEGLRTLEEKNIIARIISDGEDHSVFKLTDISHWK
jgi:hypothetical protein